MLKAGDDANHPLLVVVFGTVLSAVPVQVARTGDGQGVEAALVERLHLPRDDAPVCGELDDEHHAERLTEFTAGHDDFALGELPRRLPNAFRNRHAGEAVPVLEAILGELEEVDHHQGELTTVVGLALEDGVDLGGLLWKAHVAKPVDDPPRVPGQLAERAHEAQVFLEAVARDLPLRQGGKDGVRECGMSDDVCDECFQMTSSSKNIASISEKVKQIQPRVTL